MRRADLQVLGNLPGLRTEQGLMRTRVRILTVPDQILVLIDGGAGQRRGRTMANTIGTTGNAEELFLGNCDVGHKAGDKQGEQQPYSMTASTRKRWLRW